jgi:cell division protein FtsL
MKPGSAQVRAGCRWLAINVALTAAVVTSAVAVVGTSHKCRQAYARLQMLQVAQWEMQENWSRLLLQESALATHYRVEQVALGSLQMRVPEAADTRVLLK